jgi:MbtH protein
MSLRIYVITGVVLLLFLAGLLVAVRLKASGSEKHRTMEFGPADLFVRTDSKTADLLLEDWRWKVGNEAKVFRVTVFGDLFTQGPEGQIYWLDTGGGRYIEVAKSVEQWAEASKTHGEEWFHWTTLRELRSLGVKLGEGQVYSWRHDPMLGRAESVDNVDVVSLEVHVSHAGRTAEAIKDLPPGTKIDHFDFEILGPGDAGIEAEGEGGEDAAVYEVVLNDDGQYSMWPAGEEIPAGWKSVGKQGTQQECLDYIEEVWTDVQPPS